MIYTFSASDFHTPVRIIVAIRIIKKYYKMHIDDEAISISSFSIIFMLQKWNVTCASAPVETSVFKTLEKARPVTRLVWPFSLLLT